MLDDTKIRWAGEFADPNYGRGDVPEVFSTLADARASLEARYDIGHHYPIDLAFLDGTTKRSLMPAVTPEAVLTLWKIDPPVKFGEIAEAFPNGIDTSEAGTAQHIVALARRRRAVIREAGEHARIESERKRREAKPLSAVIQIEDSSKEQA